MTIRSVITALGGLSAVSRGLGHKHPTTVQGWWERGVIPAQQQKRILDLAARRNVAVDPLDLIPGSDVV